MSKKGRVFKKQTFPKNMDSIVQHNSKAPMPNLGLGPSSSSGITPSECDRYIPKCASAFTTKFGCHLTYYNNYWNRNEPFKYDIVDMLLLGKQIENFYVCKVCGCEV